MPKSLLEQLPEIVALGRKQAEKILEGIESRQRVTLQTREVVLPAKDSAVQDWVTSQTRTAQREVFAPGQTESERHSREGRNPVHSLPSHSQKLDSRLRENDDPIRSAPAQTLHCGRCAPAKSPSPAPRCPWLVAPPRGFVA